MLRKMVLNLPRRVMCTKNIIVIFYTHGAHKTPTLKEAAKTNYQQR